MNQDFRMVWDNEESQGDMSFSLLNNDFEIDEGLTTAVLVSIFTDAYAEDGDNYDDENDRRGWWGDLVSDIDDRIGSKFWLLDRSKSDQQTLNLAKNYLFDCLAWMVDDGVASKINVETERDEENRLLFKIEILKSDGSSVTYKFDKLWEGQYAL